MEAGNVACIGERPDQDHLAPVPGRRDRILSAEHDPALRRAGRGIDAGDQYVVPRRVVKGGMQQRVERAGVDRPDRLAP